MRYLEDRGLKPPVEPKVWAFLGDGETDEPESLGAITLASREKLDNLIFVINCNLQRLDGPVRGNGQIIQELEAVFRGAGWNVIKVIWGSDWDALLDKDTRRAAGQADGRGRRRRVPEVRRRIGAYIRKHFLGADPRLLEMVGTCPTSSSRSCARRPRPGQGVRGLQGRGRAQGPADGDPRQDHQGLRPRRGGRGQEHHPPAEEAERRGAARVPHAVRHSDCRRRGRAAVLPPAEDSPEMDYLRERRKALGGFVPCRSVQVEPAQTDTLEPLRGVLQGQRRPQGLDDDGVRAHAGEAAARQGDRRAVVPIVPDEARTFGMEALFRQVGIYSHVGQLYEPVDMDVLLYKEAKDGQILEEGITEAGSMSSFIAAGRAYATHGVNTIPFFIYYSMFGFQRIGDLIWAAADTRTRGFLLGGTAGRTTLAGEGLQHQDGNSHVYSLPRFRTVSYDPAYAYELAVIIEDGIRGCIKRRRGRLLLPDPHERGLRDAADARRRRGRDPQGPVPSCTASEGEGQAAGAAARQRRHPQRGAAAQEILARTSTWRLTCGA